MATVARSNSRVNPPVYKDYVNFLASYKNGKKEEEEAKHFSRSNSDSGVSVKNFSLAESSNSTSSSSLSSDVTDFSKQTCASYSSYLQSTKTKKFSSVKPTFEEKNEDLGVTSVGVVRQNFEEKTKTKKSEIFIEIVEPVKSVSEVSKMFETQKKSPKINSRISIFEKQVSTESKPKLATKPVAARSASSPKIDKPQPVVPPSPKPAETSPPPPPPMPSAAAPKPANPAPPPPPPPMNPAQPAKIQATLTRGPQTRFAVNNPTGVNEIDRNDPLVRKLVYGTLRGLYGAYHDKASDMLATLPKNMVVRSNGVQDRIDQIAANGDLDKLNGRVNPKLEQE